MIGEIKSFTTLLGGVASGEEKRNYHQNAIQ